LATIFATISFFFPNGSQSATTDNWVKLTHLCAVIHAQQPNGIPDGLDRVEGRRDLTRDFHRDLAAGAATASFAC
jgi:hypothetical protein